MYELHDFAHSSSAQRVRIALALKGIDHDRSEVALTRGGQHEADFLAVNPQGMVPVYSDEQVIVSQSLAIIEYLNERYPDPPLLPNDLAQRARARQLAQIIACDIHPLNALRVHTYLRDSLGSNIAARRKWFHHWLLDGLDAVELWLTAAGGDDRYCIGNSITIADICLIPQLEIARRNQLDVDDFPRIANIENNCRELAAFRDSSPNQAA